MDIILRAKLNAYAKGNITDTAFNKIYTSKIDEKVSLDLTDPETELPIYSIKKRFNVDTSEDTLPLIEVLSDIHNVLDYTISFDDGTDKYYGLSSLAQNYVSSDDYIQGLVIEDNVLYLDLTLPENRKYTVDIQVIFE